VEGVGSNWGTRTKKGNTKGGASQKKEKNRLRGEGHPVDE